MLFLQSPVLFPLIHGFSTRLGGVSPPPYGSLNLGKKWGDEADNVHENLRRLAQAAGFSTIHVAKQVHGARVIEAVGLVANEEADAVYTRTPGVTVGVSIADCVPILFHDPATGLVAAAHAGWRGTVARIAERTVEQLKALGAKELRAALGPSICGKCFEVGEEVSAQFAGFTHGRYVDLHAANRAQLLQAGLRDEHIDATPPCTMHNPDRFFSYRRDKGLTGSHLAFVTHP